MEEQKGGDVFLARKKKNEERFKRFWWVIRGSGICVNCVGVKRREEFEEEEKDTILDFGVGK